MENAVTSNGGGARPPRLPRWTRQEILVLIQGKKVAESRGRGRGRLGSSRLQQMGSSSSDGGGEGLPVVIRGASTVEPKWASVSSYCSRRGVNRGPVQCRKRWSNLAGDYKKIKEWELKKRSEGEGGGDDEKESFWVMRNDLRRERKLPGFFDREVFDILDGKEVEPPPIKEGVGRVGGDSKQDGDGVVGGSGTAGREITVVEEEDEEKEEAEAEAAVFDSGRTTADDGLFSDSNEDDKDKDDGRSSPLPIPSGVPVAVTPISERKFDPSFISGSEKDRGKEKSSEREERTTGGRKRQRPSGASEETSGEKENILQQQLVEILDRNSRMMTEQLEAQNMNCRLDREQRADMARSVVEVLGKLAEAIGKIAEKL
ncbi:hypothetical protein ZOSMA_11G00210 [Zostera marina]|uniref:Myb/SANT-like DNA-binding domain-containing protein n=1 Tax=Zostera marina TaxID=29655 RepID=A0A0K9Q3F8_ZOSMR|nr:hypothetical protein ZOSMA_11G00210 [Zostera marina]